MIHNYFTGTDNKLAENGGYENVTIVRDLSPPDHELLQYINNGIIPGQCQMFRFKIKNHFENRVL